MKATIRPGIPQRAPVQPGPSRREFLAATAAGLASTPAFGQSKSAIRAIAFDAFVLFDTHSVVARAREITGRNSEALVAWASAKLFAYTWFYTSSGKYATFDELAADAFNDAARAQGIDLSPPDCRDIVASYSNLATWPDVGAALDNLASPGTRLAMLSNLSEKALRTNLRGNGIEKHFEFVLSTDAVKQFKPAPRAYDLAARAFRAPVKQIGFAASAGWDAAGATWFGYPTVWVNRASVPAEQAHIRPRLVSTGMEGVLTLARS